MIINKVLVWKNKFLLRLKCLDNITNIQYYCYMDGAAYKRKYFLVALQHTRDENKTKHLLFNAYNNV